MIAFIDAHISSMMVLLCVLMTVNFVLSVASPIRSALLHKQSLHDEE